MPSEIVYYITKYGYLAIFILVFLQEIGMPNPIPNELLLVFSGYLSFKGLLFLPFVILTAISADFIGTNILYFLFYKTGALIIRKKPKWVPLSAGLMDRLTNKISKEGQLRIYIFRLTPFTRGYTSVITGLLQIKPNVFLPIALITSISWATIYVVIGHLIGPSWNLLTKNIESFKYLLIAILAVILSLFIVLYYSRRRTKLRVKEDINDFKTI